MLSPNRETIVALQLILLSTSLLAASDQATDERKGRTIVQMNCATCHAIGRQGESPTAKAPPFRDLHKRYPVEKTFRRRSGKELLLVTPRCRSSSSNRSRWTRSSITSRLWSDNEPVRRHATQVSSAEAH